MTTESMPDRKLRLVEQANKKRQLAVLRLSKNYWAVESQRYAGEYHCVRFDGHSGQPVDCAPVMDEEACYGWEQFGYCSHSEIALQHRNEWLTRHEEPPTADDTLLADLTASVEACKRIEAAQDECPFDEAGDTAPPEFEFRREAEAKAAAAEEHARLAPVPATQIRRVNGRPELMRRPLHGARH